MTGTFSSRAAFIASRCVPAAPGSGTERARYPEDGGGCRLSCVPAAAPGAPSAPSAEARGRGGGRDTRDGASLTAAPRCPRPQDGTAGRRPRLPAPSRWQRGLFHALARGAGFLVAGLAVPFCPCASPPPAVGPVPPRPPAQPRVLGRSPAAPRLSPPQCAVQVKLELGHRAQVRKKPTVEGFTHDWMVFVRGPEHSNIQHFVEKVVFHLHESFPRPKRGR